MPSAASRASSWFQVTHAPARASLQLRQPACRVLQAGAPDLLRRPTGACLLRGDCAWDWWAARVATASRTRAQSISAAVDGGGGRDAFSAARRSPSPSRPRDDTTSREVSAFPSAADCRAEAHPAALSTNSALRHQRQFSLTTNHQPPTTNHQPPSELRETQISPQH
jgi:hypothetical protein